MTAFSKQLADKVANHFFLNTSETSPSQLYVALHVSGGSVPSDPSDIAATAFASEASWASYTRQTVTFSSVAQTDYAQFKNSNAVTFPAVNAGAGPVTITGISIWTAQKGASAAVSGVYMAHAAMTTVKTLNSGDRITFDANDITFDVGE